MFFSAVLVVVEYSTVQKLPLISLYFAFKEPDCGLFHSLSEFSFGHWLLFQTFSVKSLYLITFRGMFHFIKQINNVL